MGGCQLRVELPNGMTWGAGQISSGSPKVFVPIDVLDDLGDDEIGKFVRLCVPKARLAKAILDADGITQYAGTDQLHDAILAYPEYDRAYFEQFAGQDPIIDQVIRVIDGYYHILEERAQKKKASRKRRGKFSASRDRLLLQLAERDGYRCKHCGATKGLTVDHIVPVSKDGSDALDNLQILCQICNSKKGNRRSGPSLYRGQEREPRSMENLSSCP